MLRVMAYRDERDFIKRYGDQGEDELADAGGTIPQRLLMMNGKLVDARTADNIVLNASTRIAALAPDDATAIETCYLTTLARRPTALEAAHFAARLADTKGNERRQRIQDLYWNLAQLCGVLMEPLAHICSRRDAHSIRCIRPPHVAAHRGPRRTGLADARSVSACPGGRAKAPRAGPIVDLRLAGRRAEPVGNLRSRIQANRSPPARRPFPPPSQACSWPRAWSGVAEQLGSVTLVRNLLSKEGDHQRGSYFVKTGYRPDPTVIHPSIGAICCHQLPVGKTEIPRHISILPDIGTVCRRRRIARQSVRRLQDGRSAGESSRRRVAGFAPTGSRTIGRRAGD